MSEKKPSQKMVSLMSRVDDIFSESCYRNPATEDFQRAAIAVEEELGLAGLPDPKAAIEAAREAMKAAKYLLSNCDEGTAGKRAYERLAKALALLNAK